MKFAARERFDFSNDAVGWRSGGPMDCLGPYAKVQNCPIMVDGVEVGRRTCYATGYANTFFSVTACTRWKGRYVGGYFTGECEFHPYDRFKGLFTTAPEAPETPLRSVFDTSP